MKCRSVKVECDTHEDGRPVVGIILGNIRRVGAIDEVAWAHIPPGMAREIAANLIEAADKVDAQSREVNMDQ
jgi:hypothetical protein